MIKKTFEIKGVDLTSLYGVGDKNIIFLEKQLPLQLNVRGNNIFCQGLKKDINHFDSVLNQTFRNFEVLVIDNNSSDGTKEIVDNFSDQRIKYYFLIFILFKETLLNLILTSSTPNVKNKAKYINPLGISICAASSIKVNPISIRKQSAKISREG